MHLDEKVAVLKEKEPNKAKTFDYWLRLSTIEKRNILTPIDIGHNRSVEVKFPLLGRDNL